MPTPPRPQPVALRIELLDVVPLVWRRVLVSNPKFQPRSSARSSVSP